MNKLIMFFDFYFFSQKIVAKEKTKKLKKNVDDKDGPVGYTLLLFYSLYPVVLVQNQKKKERKNILL